MSADPDYNSTVKGIINERSKININLLPTGGGGSKSPSCRVCHVELQLIENDTIYICRSCGVKFPLSKVKYESRVKSRYGTGQSKPFIQSQNASKKDKPEHVKEAEGYFGGTVTSWTETEYE